MKNLLIVFLLTTLAYSDNYWNQDDDKPYFQQRDNQAHIVGYGLLSSVVTYYAVEEYHLTTTQAWFIGVGTSVLIGAIKEANDKNFDWDDMSSVALGGVIGSSIVVYTF